MTTIRSLLLLLLSFPAYAAPVATATSEGAVITLFDEPCALTEVSNLPMRATWTDKGQTWEGCFSVHPQGIVILYFSGDKTVAIAPRSAFQRVTGV
jgi:hypothetical protein